MTNLLLHKIAHPRQQVFLSVYQQVGTVSAAARESGVGRRTHYHWLATDSEYKAAFESARENICRQIEDGLVDRLIYGTTEPVFYKGKKVGERRKFDNTASIAYLDRHGEDWHNSKVALEASNAGEEPGQIVVKFTHPPGYQPKEPVECQVVEPATIGFENAETQKLHLEHQKCQNDDQQV